MTPHEETADKLGRALGRLETVALRLSDFVRDYYQLSESLTRAQRDELVDLIERCDEITGQKTAVRL